MAIQPQEASVAPDAVFTQTPPAPPTPQPDGRDRSAWNGWPSRNTAQPKVIFDDQERITRIRTPVMDLEGHMSWSARGAMPTSSSIFRARGHGPSGQRRA